MLRRWLIRSPSLLALTYVVGVWIASYFGAIGYTVSTGDGIAAVQGLCAIDKEPVTRISQLHFLFWRDATPTNMYFEPTTCGFRWDPLWRGRGHLIIFPLWLPTFLLAALNLFIWRKTRPTPPGRAFPVQPVEGQSPASR